MAFVERSTWLLPMGILLVLLLFSSSSSAVDADAQSAALSLVKSTVDDHPIVIFSKSYCPYCKRAKGVFSSLSKAPHVVELDLRDDGRNIQDALFEFVGRRTVPQVFINGEHLGGSDDTVEAFKSGRLEQLLNLASGSDL
ncbi:hypothetical protein O6H91_10G071500 [Diphasiastrum complanatum]|uniref:Uncharacterized protein n=1 Tax=Diphasiastrum complanatum TaxID=34168 RepID=A0ACC2CIC1_DIPCM|nr:hypothetical protein O6H91_10G071500 [Diphasiastrum complanatum]